MKAAREALAAPGWGDALLNQLAHTHPATSTGESMKNRCIIPRIDHKGFDAPASAALLSR